ncbi:MAG: hypothetical protein RR688_04065 [Carnobacterium sp.]|uniref:hypothetical protein n=1 Tax=Carnobacterium sp. TaxID=48221 RepID=UPI002FC842B6
MNEDWMEVIIYLVSFTAPNEREVSRLLVFKENVSKEEILEVLLKRFPNIVSVEHIDEWGIGFAPHCKETFLLEDSY